MDKTKKYIIEVKRKDGNLISSKDIEDIKKAIEDKQIVIYDGNFFEIKVKEINDNFEIKVESI